MAVVGRAQVLVVPTFTGFQRTVGQQMPKQGEQAASKFSTGFGSKLKVGAVATGAAVAGVLSATLVKGFSRLKGIEDAQAKLRGLGHDAKEVEGIMRDALASVKGTAFGLDEAATTAAGAVAAGIKPGKDLAQYLKTVADVAAQTNTSMEESGRVLNQARTIGAAYNDTLQTLAQRGLPIYQILAKQLGVSTAAVKKLASEGKISAQTLETALRTQVAGAALETGNTTAGAFKNMGAAISRVGANLLSGVFPQFRAGFASVIAALGPMEGKAKTVGAAIGTFLARAVVVIVPKVQQFVTIFREQVVPVLIQVGSFLIKRVVPALASLAGWISRNSNVLLPLAAGIGAAVLAIQAIITAVKIWTIVQGILNVVLTANPIGLIIVGIVALVAAFVVAYKKSETFRKVVNGALNGIKIAVAAVIGFITQTALPAIKKFFTNLATGARVLWAGFRATGAAIKGFFVGIGSAVNRFWTAAIRPVFEFINRGFRAVGRGFSAVYNGLIKPILQLFAAVTKTVLTVAIGGAIAQLQTVWRAMGLANRAIYNSVIKPILDFFSRRVTEVKTAFGIATAALRVAWGLLASKIRDGYNATIRPILTFFTTKVNAVKTSFGVATGAIRTAWGVLGSGMRSVYNTTLKPLVTGFGTIIGKLKTTFKTAVAGIATQWDRLKEVAKAPVRFVIEKVINGLIGPENGSGGGFNALAKTFGTTAIKRVPLPPGFREGGSTGNLPTSAVAGLVHGNEHVWTAREVVAAGGHRVIEGLRAAVLAGQRIPGYATGGRVKPTRSGRQNASYPGHPGIDFYGVTGDPIFATTAGQISYAGSGRGYGNAVFQTALNGLQMVYGHMSQILAKVGQVVSSGAQIGKVGYSGNVRPKGPMGAHLHYEVAPGGGFSQASNRAATQAFLGGAVLGGKLSGAGTDTGFNPIDAIKGILTGPLGRLKEITDSPFGRMIASFPRAFANMLKEKATSLLGGGLAKVGKSMAAGAWAPVLTTALGMNRLPLSQLDNWIRQVQSESGGNPRAIQQVRDVNSGGNEAAGLLQVIPGTFAAYRSKLLPNDRLNPLANAYAAMNYAKNRYGSSIESVIGYGHGYDSGGFLQPGLTLAYNGTRRPEPVLTGSQFDAMSKGGGPVLSGNFYGYVPDDIIEAAQAAQRRRDILSPSWR